MSATLERATRALAERLSDECVAERIGRADVDKHGRLVLQVGDDRWFRFAGEPGEPGELSELDPRDDRRVRLARDAHTCGAIVSYRPERRIVIRCSAPDSTTTYAKGLRRGRSAQAAARHRLGARAARDAGFIAPELVDVDAESDVLRFAELAGAPLTLDDPARFRQLGRTLRAFQELAGNTELELFGPDQVQVELDRWAAKARAALGRLPTGWAEARELWSSGQPSAPSEPVLAHRDLHDGQLIVGPLGFGLLDFDGLARADAALDLGNLHAHLDLRGLQGWRGATQALARRARGALLAGHGRMTDGDFVERLQFYRTGTILRLALLYALRPRWSAIVPALVRFAEPDLRRSSS